MLAFRVILRSRRLTRGWSVVEGLRRHVDYLPRRPLDKTEIRQIARCQWVEQHQSMVITGATGVGKTYLACALAQQAIR